MPEPKRVVDLAVAGALLVLTSPVLAALALAVRLTSPGPVLHRSTRVGRDGEPFEVLKFRTMVVGAAAAGPGVTVRGDPRITRVGRYLRWSKLDELPQLLNVVAGHMSLVGPRPEDPRYVALYDDDQRRILALRPGVTSPASLQYRHEEAVLAASDDPERTYREVVMPDKLRIDLDYFDRATLSSDLRLLGATLRRIVERG